jgi:adenine-specific DNA-methyltransferase
MSENLNKLKAILREMFQLDQADLDFGIYRIMNQKREEIEQFLGRDLLPQVKTAFAQFEGEDLQAVRDELDKLKKTLDDAGVVAETSPKYQALQAKLSSSVDVSALENEVFSQLTNFFRRYYQGGDFLSLRRYKAGVYAIPYEGEEVKLHWANADQYYIKSSENFRDYTFKLPSGKRAHFKLVDASTEQNNKKEQAGKERRFILVEDTPLVVDNGELYIRFEYRVADESSKQATLNDAAVQAIIAAAGEEWKRELSALAPTEKNARRTLLEKHLNDYTAKYSFDYFIHKDLGGFLRRELDFFIKNEILFIDDLDTDHVRASISKVKVIKEIGHKVIAFLEQLENFQKKLWLKKKFVVETGYCCTLDKVPEELYPAIVENKAQIAEWEKLGFLTTEGTEEHREKQEENLFSGLDSPSDSEGLPLRTSASSAVNSDFLKANPFLVLDTAFYDQEFTEKLLASFDSLEAATDGLLVHSENFQALNLMLERYRGQVKCTYIDPPYNTGGDDFIYKDNYQHSSWATLLADRVSLGLNLLNDNGVFLCSLDDLEAPIIRMIVSCNSLTRLGEFVWKTRNTDNRIITNFSQDHEYIHVWARTNIAGRIIDRSDFKNADNDPRGPYVTDPLTGKANATQRPNLHYYITNPETGDQYPPDPDFGWITNEVGFLALLHDNRIYWPSNPITGKPRKKRFLEEMAERAPVSSLEIKIKQGEGNQDLINLFNSKKLNFPKPTSVIQRAIDFTSTRTGVILDFFAGSGTTAHAVINQNREDNGNRKYILVEMGEHFDAVLKPRIQKVVYSKDWKDGKPVSRQGSSHLFKYIRLESYEDALNNLQLKRTPEQGSLLDQHDKLREQYMLSYMLDVESAGSASLLNIDSFTNPFNYRMNIARGNETKETVVDLVETFNWLLGIKVLRISQKEHRAAEFETDSEGRLNVKGRPRTCAAGEGWTFQEVEGQTLAGDKVLIIWRTLTDNPEQDNVMLDEWFGKRNYNTLDFEFSRIYVNGDNNLENLKIGEERWKVALIEQEFKKLMFDVEGV